MKLNIGENAIYFNSKNYPVLGSGKEGCVYLYDDQVLKIFSNLHLNQELFYQYLIDLNLDLHLIHLPKQLVYDKNNELCGTISDYVEGKNKQDFLSDLEKQSKSEFMDGVYLLKKDVDKLSQYGVTVEDICLQNSIYQDGYLHHIDFGFFQRKKDLMDAYALNTYLVGDYYLEILMEISSKIPKSSLKEIASISSSSALSFIENEWREEANLKEFVKTLV